MKSFRPKLQQGLTLIELMVVVAIISIISSVAIPTYQDYLARAQATEAAALLDGLEASIAAYYSTNGAPPNITSTGGISGGQLGTNIVTAGKFVASIDGPNFSNQYTATFKSTVGSINAKLAGHTITMTFNTTTGKFQYDCSTSGGTWDQSIKPTICQ